MLGDIPLDKNLKFKFLKRHQVLAYDNTVKVDPTSFVEFIKAIPSKQSLRLYDCVVIDQNAVDEKLRLFNDVFFIRDPHPHDPNQYMDFHFATAFAPLHILFFLNPDKFDQWSVYNNDMWLQDKVLDGEADPEEDFHRMAFLDVGVALGCLTGYALSLGLNPSFLTCTVNKPAFPYNENSFICSLCVGKGISFTNNRSKSRLHENRAKLFRPPSWDIFPPDKEIGPTFMGDHIVWLQGDDYVQNKVEMYGV